MRERDSKAEYEATWSNLARYVDDCVEAGKTGAAAISREVTQRELSTFVGGSAFQAYVPFADERLVVRDGAYMLSSTPQTRELIVSTLSDFLSQNKVDAIVALGSGMGRNLFFLMERLGQQASSFQFHACEYTEAGRELCRRIRDGAGLSNLHIHAFDYRNPHLSFLNSSENVLFFSAHSVEQITVMPRAILHRMIEGADECSCFHFEPIGWQFDPELKRWREKMKRRRALGLLSTVRWKALRALDVFFGSHFAKGFKGIAPSDVVLGSGTKTSRNAAVWSFNRNYNENMADILVAAEEEGLIKIFRKDLNVTGEVPFNPTSVVAWKKC